MKTTCDKKSSENLEESSLDDLVSRFIRYNRQDSAKDLRFFASQRTLKDTVAKAALAKLPGGRKHSHQYRIPSASLNEAKERLLKTDLSRAKSFDELHEIVKEIIQDIHMIGALTIYDTAHRIGAYLGLRPDKVYLHRGTLAGAQALGLNCSSGTLKVTELPAPLRRLSPDEIENFLCIYKGDLKEITPRY